jgi:hypothetical protein
MAPPPPRPLLPQPLLKPLPQPQPNAMATPRQLQALEARARRREARRVSDAGLAGLTLPGALREAGEALVGIPRDAFAGFGSNSGGGSGFGSNSGGGSGGGGGREVPLAELLGGNRLRGLGVLLVAVGLAGLLLDAVLD